MTKNRTPILCISNNKKLIHGFNNQLPQINKKNTAQHKIIKISEQALYQKKKPYKLFLTSLVIKEMQIKTITNQYPFTRLAKTLIRLGKDVKQCKSQLLEVSELAHLGIRLAIPS